MTSSVDAVIPLAYSDPRGSGIPILLVHGFFHNRSVWEKLAAALPKGMRPILVDLRGHGASPWSPRGDYHLERYARDLSALLDQLKIKRVFVVGHSLGGNVSTLLADDLGDRVRGLVLVDTGPSLESNGTDHVVGEVENALRSYTSISQWRDQLAQIHPLGDPEVLDRLAATAIVERPDGRFEPALDPGVIGGVDDAAGAVDLVALEARLWSALRGLDCPVLVVRGALSSILREKVAREMVDEALRDGRLVTLEKAGHAIMIDDGPGLLAAIRDFVSPLA